MSVNLGANIRELLKIFNLRSVTSWTDSTVVLYSLREKGNHKIFVVNRVKKILQKKLNKWKYASTKKNPPDTESRCCTIAKLPQIWFKGPNWLCNTYEWPEQLNDPTSESQQETKIASDLVITTIEKNKSLDRPLEKFKLWKVLRVSVWINRFINNRRKTKVRGLLTTSVIDFGLRESNRWFKDTEKVNIDVKSLDLQENGEFIYARAE